MKKGLFISTAVLALFSVLGCSKNDENVIKIGGMAPLSGQYTQYGLECKKGIDLAISEINAAGGVNGKKLEFICEDDEGVPAKSVNAYKKLTAQNGVRFIIGSLTSGATIAITKLAQANKVVQIAPAATNPEVTSAGNYIFRACYTDPFQGKVCGKFAAENLGAKNVAILYDISNDYSVGLTDNFISEYTKRGGKIVATESYNTGDKDFNAQLTKLKAAQPDAVYLPDYYATVALIAKQLRAQGINVPIVGADGWDGLVGLYEGEGGDEVLNGYYSNHYASDSTDPAVAKYVKAFTEKYNEAPNSFAALGYDAVYMLRDAFAAAGCEDPAKVRDALEATNGNYVTGHVTFDADHNPVKSAVMIKLVKIDGKLATAYEATVDVNE